MSELSERFQPPPLAKYFFAISLGKSFYHAEVEQCLAQEFGPLGKRSEIYNFSHFSHYYDKEMGGETWKYLIGVQDLLPADQLVRAKLLAETIQLQFVQKVSGASVRTVNLDPGYLNGWQLVLSSVKNSCQRIYLDSGVFSEVTMLYRKKDYLALPWTYPDYASPPVKRFLLDLRNEYNSQLPKQS